MSVAEDILRTVELPRMIQVRQHFDRAKITDVAGAVLSELEKPEISSKVCAGHRICLTAGSRGVSNIALVLKTVAGYLRSKGAIPFIIPAMGSHGGATSEGQAAILGDYGITEKYCGCEIISSMEITGTGTTPDGQEVYIDKHAAEADGIIVINRIKPHTAFRGPYESGLMKMMAIGLGKQYGAEACHKNGFKLMAEMVPAFGKTILKNCKILFGVGIIENAFDETYMIKALTPPEIITEEPKLLKIAKTRMPSIRFDTADVLIVDRIGKNISGDGMDPNITGTWATPYASGGFSSERVAVLDLTDESGGNAVGIGMADVTTDRAVNKISTDASYPNCLTSLVLNIIKIPMHFRNDEFAIKAAVKACTGGNRDAGLRIIHISDSLHLEDIWISEPMLEEAVRKEGVEIVGKPLPFAFNGEGNLSAYV
ncbi:MAG: lactate racemase domain-containing protein [Eubacteriales bacterium]|nr:lactate racemase domain-containing protein [Eubacteriales bacterium]